ncbi:hypothetical protein [Winogradskyella sp.]|uniref:hypothetical protein n=1 Tax=Winogradskyella sp. TaxID=1883156 RepID=UPI002611A4D9|nr:hypothetical protein [Winogradskyella sp.]
MSKKSFALYIVLFLGLFITGDQVLHKVLIKGLNQYYGIDEPNEIALVGHSHLMLGLDKVRLEKALDKGISKYTREGVNVNDRLVMVRQLIDENPNLKTVIYGVDAWTFTGEGLSDNSYKLFYPFLDSPNIDEYVYNNSEKLEYLTKKHIKSSRYNELLLAGAVRGYFNKWDNLKFGELDTLKLKMEIDKGNYRKIANNEANITVFKETMALLMANDIKVVLLYVPTIDMLETIQKEEFDETIQIFKSQTNGDITFLNFQEPWSHRYELFFDPIHLNPQGQKKITDQLISFLKTR